MENLRNYAHTPLTDAMQYGGNLSPMQVRSGRNYLDEREANNSVAGAIVHRSVEGKPTSMAGARIRQ